MPTFRSLIALAFVALAISPAFAQPKKPATPEDEYYRLLRFPMSEHLVLEAGALELMPDGKLAVGTRRGDIYLVDQPFAEATEDAFFAPFASGLHEILGLAWRDGWLYCVLRCEVTRITD
jgi:hypothetical protein